MKKYLVIADTYDAGYGVEYYLFAICNSEEEAIQWVLNHPIVHVTRNNWGELEEHEFSFFKFYGKTKKNITKEEFIREVYIHEFTENTPMFIGDYIE